MKNLLILSAKFIRLEMAVLLSLTLLPTSAFSEDVKGSMKQAFESFQSLQPYLVDTRRFEDKQNETTVYNLIASLRDNFHQAGSLPSHFRNQPGFVPNVTILSEVLDDAAIQFREGRKGYASWRLRGISQNCFSCHATYNVELSFDAKQDDLNGLTNLQKGEFYIATRQLDKAEKHLRQALKEEASGFSTMTALRQLLTLYVRIKGDPASALTGLAESLKGIDLPKNDHEEVNFWLASLKQWKEEKTQIRSVSEAESLIKRTLQADVLDNHIDAVSLLRATGSIHRLLGQKNLPAADRAKGLYLLGLSYYKLPLFFIYELPELYLEECIEESPATPIAQRAYRLYEESTKLGFTGSGGTELPSDVRIKMMELHDKAFGGQKMTVTTAAK